MNSTIKQTARLLQDEVIQLINKEILALRIFPFVSRSKCDEWTQKLKNNNTMDRYSNALDVPVNRIGMTLFETENKPEKIEQYLEEGKQTKTKIRSIFGLDNPLEKLINNLSESWGAGCHIQSISEKEMNLGIIRSFEPSIEGGLPPHVDSLLKDLPDMTEFDDMKCQIAANLYFDIPEKGGELELWNFEPTPDELEKLYSGDYDFIDRKKIPVSSQIIKPRIGELILFRSNCVHSVIRNEIGERAAASCFIGYYDVSQALTIWA